MQFQDDVSFLHWRVCHCSEGGGLIYSSEAEGEMDFSCKRKVFETQITPSIVTEHLSCKTALAFACLPKKFWTLSFDELLKWVNQKGWCFFEFLKKNFFLASLFCLVIKIMQLILNSLTKSIIGPEVDQTLKLYLS